MPSGFLTYKLEENVATVCPRRHDPFQEVSCYIKWVKTSWTHSKQTQSYCIHYEYEQFIISVPFSHFLQFFKNVFK